MSSSLKAKSKSVSHFSSLEEKSSERPDNEVAQSKARSVKSRDEEMRPVARYMNAAKEGNLQAVKAILENELKVELVDVTDEYDDKKETALIYACMNGHLGVVEYLLSQGASVKYRSIAGGHATFFAAGAKGKDALRCLQLCIDNGGDITSATHRLRTPLWLSAFNGADETMAYIVGLEKTYYVFPGASGNRFEHSIGVAYLSRRFVKRLRKNQPELGITDEDILCLEIAGLCHDLGHGPFSHLFDGRILPRLNKSHDFIHEHASIGIFEILITENNLFPAFEAHNLTKEDIHFIQELILGDPCHAPVAYTLDNHW
eukprot:gene3668-5009_t